jgi:hypothetical protein
MQLTSFSCFFVTAALVFYAAMAKVNEKWENELSLAFN